MNNELIEKINELPSSEVFINRELDPLAVFSAWLTTDDLKSLASELTLANKKLELLQASNDHYADEGAAKRLSLLRRTTVKRSYIGDSLERQANFYVGQTAKDL